MISRCPAFDEHALGERAHSLDGVGVSAGDGIFEVLGMVNGKMNVTILSIWKKRNKIIIKIWEKRYIYNVEKC